MKKPTPKDFQIIQGHIDYLEELEVKLESVVIYLAAVASGLTSILIGILTYPDNTLITTLALMGLAFLFGMFGWIITFTILNMIGVSLFKHFVPAYKRVDAYKVALAKYQLWYQKTQHEFWMSLSGRRFEFELASLYRRLGHDCIVTPASNDKGIDLILNRNGERIIIQCKAHKKPVNPNVIRELIGTMICAGANKAILASLSGFSPGVRGYITDKNIELIELRDIINMQESIEE